MVIDSGRIVDPDRNAWYVAAAIAISLFVFAYSTLFGQISILAFYAVWFAPAMIAPRILLSRPWPVLVLLLVPVIFTMSTFWSDVPSATLRAGIQYGTTIFCGLVAARITSISNLALGGTIGGLLVLLYSAANGGYSYDYIDGSYAFNGAFASKNQLGYFATLALIFGISMIWVFRSRAALVPLALATSALAAVMLVMSDSATSLLAAFAAFATILMARGLVALARGLRRAAIALMVSTLLAAGLAATRLGAFDAVLGAFGKDSTLTGRTYLWSKALEIGGQHPWVGIGYGAFWTQGRPAAEELWEEFYITARTGFHFHNLLMETYVGMGALGLLVVGIVCLLLLILPIAGAFRIRRLRVGHGLLGSGDPVPAARGGRGRFHHALYRRILSGNIRPAAPCRSSGG